MNRDQLFTATRLLSDAGDQMVKLGRERYGSPAYLTRRDAIQRAIQEIRDLLAQKVSQ